MSIDDIFVSYIWHYRIMNMTAPRDRQLHRLAMAIAKRDQSVEQARMGGLQIGALIEEGRAKFGITISEVSRHFDIPRATLNVLVKDAKAAGFVREEAQAEILRLSGGDFIEHVRTSGPIIEILASFAELDIVYLSGLPFSRFVLGDYLNAPHVLVRCEGDDDWVALDNATVGYGGTGPSNTSRALKGAGVADDVAETIAFANRVSRVTFDESGNATWISDGTEWPLVNLPKPIAMDSGRRFKFKFARSLTDDAPSIRLDLRRGVVSEQSDSTYGGFYPTDPNDGLGLAERLFKYLDDPPAWLEGPRRATLFTTPRAAREAGFADDYVPRRRGAPEQSSLHLGFGVRHVYQLVIEQGPVQIWESDFAPDDPTQWVPREFHSMLRLAGLFPSDIVERDESSALRKLMTGHRRGRPSEISLNGGVTWRPSMQYGQDGTASDDA